MNCDLCGQRLDGEFFRWGVGQRQEGLLCRQVNEATHLDICGSCNQRFPIGALGPYWYWQALNPRQRNRRGKTGKQGQVYLISDSRAVKIGNSKNTRKRTKELQTGNSSPLKVLASVNSSDCEGLEGYLHGFFEDKHRLGEWYDLDESDISIAEEILERNADTHPQALADIDYIQSLADVYFAGLGPEAKAVIPWDLVANRQTLRDSKRELA